VFVAASEEKQTEDIGFGTVIERETTDYTIGGTYVFPQSKWYAGGRYSSPETDEPLLLSRPGDVDETRYGVVAGTYFGTGATRLELSLDKLRLESEQSSGTGPPIGNDPVAGLFSSVQAETTVDEPRLEVMHVGRLRSATYALIGRVARKDARLRASYTLALPGQPAVLTDTAELDLVSDIYSVGGEIYPVPAVGVRLRYTREDGPVVSEQNTVDVAAGWFFRRNVGVELTLSSVDPEFVPRTEAGALRVIGRF
jgi:hypothetical protein